MKEAVAAHTAARQPERSPHAGSAGAHAIALAPPAYGIEFADGVLPRRREDASAHANHLTALLPGPRRLSEGAPIEPGARADMEAVFGRSFADVRVHAGAEAATAAALANANAYTVGSDIVFGAGRYAPATPSGRRLLAHELAHVAQQSGAAPSAPLSLAPSRSPHERDARDAAAAAIAGHPVGAPRPVAIETVQREEMTEDTEPRDESINVVGRGVIEGVAAGASIGMPALKPLIAGGLTGFYTEVRHQIRKGKAEAFGHRYLELLKNPAEMLAYGEGYISGVLQGLWSPVQGLVDLAKLGFKLQQMQLQALENVILHFDEVVAAKNRLVERFTALGARAGTLWENFRKNKVDSVVRLIEGLSSGAFELAKKGGQKAGRAIFSFLEKPWAQIGEGVGIVVGTVMIEAVLAFFTSGIGNAITKVGSALEKVAPTLMKGVRFIATEVGAIVAELRNVVKTIKEGIARAGRSLLKGVEDFVGEASGVFDDLVAFLQRLFRSAEEAATKLPDAHLPVPHVPAPHATAPHVPALHAPAPHAPAPHAASAPNPAPAAHGPAPAAKPPAAKPPAPKPKAKRPRRKKPADKPRSKDVTDRAKQRRRMTPEDRRKVELLEDAEDLQQRTRATGALDADQANRLRNKSKQAVKSGHRSQFVDEKGRPRTAGHHGFPQYLGGEYDQALLRLNEDLHYLYHQELDLVIKAPRKAGSRFFRRLPQEEMYTLLARVLKHAEQFDSRYQTRISAAMRRGMEEAEPGRLARVRRIAVEIPPPPPPRVSVQAPSPPELRVGDPLPAPPPQVRVGVADPAPPQYRVGDSLPEELLDEAEDVAEAVTGKTMTLKP